MKKLIVNNLSFSYRGVNILKNISFELLPGLNVLLGANGSGKTSLIKLLVTIYRPDTGELNLSGVSYKNDLEIKKNIAYVPQVFNGYKNLKVKEYLGFMNSFNRDKKVYTTENEIFGIDSFLNKKLKELSEGMKKKVLIYGAFLRRAGIIILDEPTSGLDKESRSELREILIKISKENPELIVLYSTHIEEDIFSEVSNIIELKDGEIYYNGNLENYEEIFNGKPN